MDVGQFKYIMSFSRIVERQYYNEKDAADAVRQICEAVAVSSVNIYIDFCLYYVAFVFQEVSKGLISAFSRKY